MTNVPAQAKPVAGDDDEDEACGGLRTTIEYLDHQGLEDFLLDNQRVRGDGILQRFVEPKGGRNNMLRALWSPKVCLLERRVNRLQMGDTRYDMYERAVTFEGAEFYSDLAPVRGAGLVTKVHEIADSVVQHVAGVTNDRIMISRLALNFKVDDRDRLWLLFSYLHVDVLMLFVCFVYAYVYVDIIACRNLSFSSLRASLREVVAALRLLRAASRRAQEVREARQGRRNQTRRAGFTMLCYAII